jgi:hypothetical protein
MELMIFINGSSTELGSVEDSVTSA